MRQPRVFSQGARHMGLLRSREPNTPPNSSILRLSNTPITLSNRSKRPLDTSPRYSRHSRIKPVVPCEESRRSAESLCAACVRALSVAPPIMRAREDGTSVRCLAVDHSVGVRPSSYPSMKHIGHQRQHGHLLHASTRLCARNHLPCLVFRRRFPPIPHALHSTLPTRHLEVCVVWQLKHLRGWVMPAPELPSGLS